MSDQGDELVKVLQNLTNDLLWISEIDSPFKVFQWENQSAKLTDQQILERTHHSMDTALETVSFDEFFAAATQDQDWFGTEEKAVATKYRLLVDLLKQHLSDLKVYRVGEIRINLYVVGQMQTGEVIGLVTQAVET
ncbi:nuclease A inhibitor family protein [Phormidesmis priestleyi]|uniref:nuclease A inhibitor family protein n=1 Tax=Phormidesmis priestleyi TaxID=268141 RepID=UPI00083B36D6|nr:nuclease A inhibitor family protein [Phormidesmis priestleyi]